MISEPDATDGGHNAASRAARILLNRRALPAWIAAATIVIALAVLSTAGALDTSEPEVSHASAGEEIRMPLYSITVLDAELTDEIEERSLKTDDGEILAVMTVELENLSDAPIGLGRAADKVQSQLVGARDSLLTLAGTTPTRPAEAWRSDGSAGAVFLQPGVPSEVTLAWTVPEDAFADGVVELDVFNAVPSHGQILIAADNVTWKRGELAARVTVETAVG